MSWPSEPDRAGRATGDGRAPGRHLVRPRTTRSGSPGEIADGRCVEAGHAAREGEGGCCGLRGGTRLRPLEGWGRRGRRVGRGLSPAWRWVSVVALCSTPPALEPATGDGRPSGCWTSPRRGLLFGGLGRDRGAVCRKPVTSRRGGRLPAYGLGPGAGTVRAPSARNARHQPRHRARSALRARRCSQTAALPRARGPSGRKVQPDRRFGTSGVEDLSERGWVRASRSV